MLIDRTQTATDCRCLRRGLGPANASHHEITRSPPPRFVGGYSPLHFKPFTTPTTQFSLRPPHLSRILLMQVIRKPKALQRFTAVDPKTIAMCCLQSSHRDVSIKSSQPLPQPTVPVCDESRNSPPKSRHGHTYAARACCALARSSKTSSRSHAAF